LQAGRERTADCASILRPPGTHWRKEDPPRLVEMGDIPEPFELEELDVWLQYADAPRAQTPHPVATRTGLSGKLEQAKKTLEIVDFEKLADSCAQVGNLRATRGDMPEPLWHAHLVLLSHCHSGRARAHEWSVGDARYTFEETEGYLDRAEATTGPTTCAHFRSTAPSFCEGCPHRVATPLGIATAEPKRTLPTKPVDPDEPIWKQRNFDGFAYREDGALCSGGEDPDGKTNLIVVCAQSVYLDCVQKGEIREGAHFYRFQHFLPHRGWRSVELTAGQARGQNVGGVFADLGLNIHDGDQFRRWIAQSVDHYNKERDMEVQYEQYGWKDECEFLYGDRLYRPESTAVVPASADLRVRNKWLVPREGGSLSGWRDAANRLFGAGSEGQSLAILAAFAACLMRFVNDSEGGAILSLVTRDTAGGKSTSLAGAYTVFASDRRALSLSTVDTGNSKTEALATLGNLPVFHDEFVGDPVLMAQFVREFTEGRGRQRLDRDGQMRHSVGTWQTILFTASNSSLADAIGGLDGSDAMAFRVLEFSVQSGGLRATEADALRKTLEANAGHAGHAFLEYIVRPDTLAWIKANLPVVAQDIYDYAGFGKAERFWVRALACIGVAAQIVEHLGLVAFSPERIVKWAIDHFKSVKREATPDAKAFLAKFLNQHANEMVIVPSAYGQNERKRLGVITPARVPNKLTIRREEDTGTYFIAFDAIRSWLVKHDVSIYEFQRELEKLGVSRGIKTRTLGAGTTLGGGIVKVLDIDGEHPALTGVARAAPEGLWWKLV
jgi:hypothetical protein